GQSHELTVASIEEFHAEHERRNGYARPDAPVEVVALRARGRRPAPLDPDALPLVERERCDGPAVAIEPDCTVWIPEGWVAEPGALGAWILTRTTSAETEAGPQPAAVEDGDAGLDPAALRILIGRLIGVADEMGAVLRRAAFSPNIRGRAAGRLGRQPGPPRRRWRDGTGLDPAGGDRGVPGGVTDPARPADARGRSSAVRQFPYRCGAAR